MIIEENVINEIVINKSRFITYLYKVKNKDEVLNYLNLLKQKYKDASHICYAFIINNSIKYHDDNEPLGTAGIPILEVLKKNNLNYIVCFVIRYFGGIKLGSGGLTRAYSNSASLCLKKVKIIKLEKKLKIKLKVNYQENKHLMKILSEKNILDKIFSSDITYIAVITKKEKELLDNNKLNYEILDDNYF